MTNPLVGTWELVSDTLQGLTVFTKTHHIWLYTANDLEPFSNEKEPTEAEELAAFRAMGAGAGTYSVSGSVLTTSIELNRKPNLVGKMSSWEFTIEGDRVTFKTPSSGETFKDSSGKTVGVHRRVS